MYTRIAKHTALVEFGNDSIHHMPQKTSPSVQTGYTGTHTTLDNHPIIPPTTKLE